MSIPRTKKKRLGSMSVKEARQSCEAACRQVQIIMATAMMDTFTELQREIPKQLDSYLAYLPQEDRDKVKEGVRQDMDPMEWTVRMLELSAKYSQYYEDNLVKFQDFTKSLYKSSNGEIDIRFRPF